MTPTEKTLMMVLSCLVLCPLGCHYHQEIQSQVSDWSMAMFDRETAPVRSAASASGRVEMTFDEILLLAKEREPGLLQAAYDADLGAIQKEQVLSERWPRLDLNTSLYVPLDEGLDTFSDAVYGGLFIKYDLLRAVFNADAASVADSMIQRAREREKEVTTRLYWTLVDVLLNVTYHTRALERHESALESAERGLALADELHASNRTDARIVLEWQTKVREIRTLRDQSAQQLSTAESRLKHLTGLQRAREIKVVDSDGILAAVDNSDYTYTEMEDSLSYAWKHRSDIRIAEIDLFLAEMAVIDAKQSRLPELSFGLGLGSMSMYDSWADRTLVGVLNLSVPLFDWGDARRRIAKAKIERNIQRQRMVDLVRRIALEVQESSTQIDAAMQTRDRADSWRKRQAAWMEDRMELANVQRLGPLDVPAAELAMSSAELDYDQAQWMLRKAIIQWKEARHDRLDVPEHSNGGNCSDALGTEAISGRHVSRLGD